MFCVVLFLVSVFLCGLNTTHALKVGGAHVCAVTKKHTTYYVEHLTRIGYDNYRTCCKRLFRACTSRCMRYRSKTVPYTKKSLRTTYSVVYECCKGWAPSPARDQCTIALCNPRCQQGKCTSPNVCTCHSGFQGRYCESDIDECQSRPCSQMCKNTWGSYACGCNNGYFKTDPNNPKDARCSDVDECTAIKPCRCASTVGGCKPICQNTPGSYYCSCHNGYQLMFDKRTCVDVNECESKPCSQNCQNLPGSYKCYCQAGYKKTVADPKDARCSDIDECATLNGGCNQICINKPGTFRCTCRPGYQLSYNRRTCEDVNECESKPCSQVCQNTPGSYKCTCKAGYKKVDTSDHDARCTDINECLNPLLNGCSQDCHNNVGSYTCSCSHGYRLNKNQRTCDDVNECTENKHNCQHNCHNNVGSFTCSCRPGYKLAADKKSCIALPCETITKPLNGKISCTGYVTGTTCTFGCNDGYKLIGDAKRVCQATGTWTGTSPTCSRQECPSFPFPQHGSVLQPCIELYGSSCLTKCSAGYHLVGNKTVTCTVSGGKTKWLPDNAVCKASALCTPNPCLNGGVCNQVSYSNFTCDCSGTSYTGQTCETGLISMPSFPLLIVNEASETLYVYAKPQEVLEIRPIFDKTSLKFEPEKINIYPSNSEASFEITSLKVGSFKVEFELYGTDAKSFVKPQPVFVYSKQRIITKPVDLSTNFINKNCKEATLQQCQAKLKLTSICIWDKSTNGIVAIKSPKVNLPLSLNGISKQTWTNFGIKQLLNPSNELKQYLQSRQITTCTSQCAQSFYNNDALHYITNNNIFQRAYINEINKLLPSFLRVNIDSKGRYFAANNFLSFLGDGKIVKKTSPCNRLESDNTDLYSIYLPKSSLQFLVGVSLKSTKEFDHETCIMVNLCKDTISLALRKNNYISFSKDLYEVGLTNMKMTLKGFNYGDAQTICTKYENEAPCLFVNSYADVALATTLNTNGTYLSINGKLYTKSDEKLGIEKFSKVRTLAVKGSSFYRLKLHLLGSYITLSGKSTKTSVHAKLGGSIPCPLCAGHGAKISFESSQVDIQYSYSMLKFKVTSNLNVYIPFNINGGVITGINKASKDRLNLQLRSFKKNIPVQFKQLSQAIASNKVESTIIKKYYDIFNKALTDFEASLQKNSFTEAHGNLLKLKSSSADFQSQLFGIQERNGRNIRVKFMSKFLINNLRVVRILNVGADVRKISSSEQGQIVSFDGSICLYALCFQNVNVKIYDLANSLKSDNCDKACKDKYASYIADDATIIIVTSLQDSMLSNRIKNPKGSVTKFIVNRSKYGISVSLTPLIKYFNTFEPTKFTITKEQINLEVNNLKMFENQLFSLKTSRDLETATWKNIVDKVSGQSSTFAKDLLVVSQNEYKDITTKTNQRLKVTQSRIKLAEESLKKRKIQFGDIDKKLKESEQKVRREEAKYKLYLLEQHRNQTKFDQQLRNLDPFIKKNLDIVCKFEKCKQICIPMPVCETCKDPLILDVPSLKCEAKTTTIRENIMAPKPRSCSVTQYHFQPIYTGSCKPDPKEQRASEQQLQAALVTIGTAIGSMFGMPFVGAAVGAVFGAVVGLFSSCDKTMEVVKTSWVEEKPCILLVPEIRKHIRQYSECMKTIAKTPTGFKVPYTCKCQVNDCIAKGPEPDCLSRNQNCEENRKLFLERKSKVPKTFTNLYKAVLKCQENVDAGVLKIQSANKTRQFHQREFDRIKNMVLALEEEVKFAKQSHQDASEILKEELCISNSYKNIPDIKKAIDVKNVNFDITLPLINNIRLNAQMKHQGKEIILPFVYDLNNDKDVSMKAFSRKILMSTLCKNTRSRRSTNEQGRDDDLAFKPWYIDSKATASAVRLSCVTLERTLEFLQDTVKKLNKKSNYANDLLMQLQYSSNRLNQALQSVFTAGTGTVSKTNDVIKANEELLMSANNELNKLQQQVSVSHVLNTWQNEAEIVTGFSNVSVCMGYDDCVGNAIETLGKLPTMFSVPRNTYIQKVNHLATQFKALYNEKNLIGMSTTAQNIERSITYIRSVSLHCSDTPKVSLVGGADKNLQAGSKVQLKCSVQSSLPFTYFWTHNDKIIDGENTNILRITVTKETIGLYTCVANSIVGNTTSSQVRISGFEKPKFYNEPEDTLFSIPAYKEKKLNLVCNVTDFPETTLAWYYRSFVDDVPPSIIKNANQPILTITNPTTQKSGFYFCQAFNKYGRIKSRESRVDIVPLKLADMEVTVKFDLLTSSSITVDSLKPLTTKMIAEIEIVDGVQRNLDVQVTKGTNQYHITLKLYVRPSKSGIRTLPGMFEVSSKARQQTGNAVAVFLSGLWKDGFKLRLNNGNMVRVDNESLVYDHKVNQCYNGYKLHENGFSCVQCPYGTAGKGCVKCPLNTYADVPGLTTCRKCDYEKITEGTGSTKKSQCLPVRARKTDIIFAIDTSTNFLRQSSNVLPEIKKFITQFVQTYKGGKDTRYSLVTYYKYVDIYLTLNEYLDTSDLLVLLDLLDEGSSTKDIGEALMESRMVFEDESSNAQKKILIVFTNGFSQGDYSGSGFVKSKREAVALQQMGAHVIAVGTGSIDFAEFKGIASYPKKENALSAYSISSTLKSALKSIDNFLGGRCYTASVDFGILLEGRSGRSTAELTAITKLLAPLHKAFMSQSFSFIPKYKPSSSNGFSTFSETSFKTKLESYVKSQTSVFDIYQRIYDAGLTDLTEQQRSYATIKNLLVISTNPLDENRLKGLRTTYYGETINIFNYVIESSTVERTEGPLSSHPRAGRMTFGFDEINILIKFVNEKKNQKVCH